MLYLIAASFILWLRLVIWRFFPGLESALKDDLSNMIIAGAIYGLASCYFIHKSVRRESLPVTGLEGPLALLLAAAAASAAWTLEPWLTVRSLLMLLAYVLYFYMLFSLLSQEHYRRIFLWVFFAAALLVAAVGINDILVLNKVSAAEVENARLTNRSLYYILINKRACSFFGWPNVLAGFLMLAMPLAGALAIGARSWAVRVFVLAGAGVLLTAFFFTFSFLGWSIFLVTAAGIFALLVWTRRIRLSVKMIWAAGACVAVGLALFTGVILKKNFSGSISPRQEYMRIVGATIAEHPVRGAGFGAYFPASSRFVMNLEGLTAFAHNSYAQIWAETGLPGLVAIVWLVGLLIFWVWRYFRRKDQGPEFWVMLAAAWGMLAYLLDNINSFTMLKPNASFFFWTWLAVFCSYFGTRDRAFPSSKNAARVIMGVLVLAALAGLFLAARFGFSLACLRDARAAVNAGQAKAALPLFERARQLNPLDSSVPTSLGDVYLRAFRANKQVAALDAAQAFFMEAAVKSPNAYYNHLALSSIYTSRGSSVMARESLIRARYVSPYETGRDLEAAALRRE